MYMYMSQKLAKLLTDRYSCIMRFVVMWPRQVPLKFYCITMTIDNIYAMTPVSENVSVVNRRTDMVYTVEGTQGLCVMKNNGL